MPVFCSPRYAAGLQLCSSWTPSQLTKADQSTSLLQYEEGSAPALALQATKQRTEKRFANYAGSNLLCGTDGLPHLIADPGLALRFGHAGEVFVSLPCSY